MRTEAEVREVIRHTEIERADQLRFICATSNPKAKAESHDTVILQTATLDVLHWFIGESNAFETNVVAAAKRRYEAERQ